jgi:hypothetical protein
MSDLLERINALTDDEALLCLEQWAARVRETLTPEVQDAVRDEREARSFLAAVERTVEPSRVGAEAAILPNGPNPEMVRRILDVAAGDPETRETVLAVLDHPPVQRQMAAPELLNDLLLLGAVVTFLQTRLRIHVARGKDGVEYKVEVDKPPASARTVQEYVSAALHVLTGG